MINGGAAVSDGFPVAVAFKNTNMRIGEKDLLFGIYLLSALIPKMIPPLQSTTLGVFIGEGGCFLSLHVCCDVAALTGGRRRCLTTEELLRTAINYGEVAFFCEVEAFCEIADGAMLYLTISWCSEYTWRCEAAKVRAAGNSDHSSGSHENIVSYYSSWFEDEQLYIQMELCDHSLSISRCGNLLTEAHALQSPQQITKALHFIHERGIAHLDLKPDNIYVKNSVYKLGDFGCATLLDKSLPIEEGDARYMPREILKENYDCLDKVDIFFLGVTIYELARGSPLPISGKCLMIQIGILACSLLRFR